MTVIILKSVFFNNCIVVVFLKSASTALGFYLVLMLFARLMGLRSFSNLSSYDFAMTVAIGSILASTILSDSPSLL
jgi:uncharacterized membrane protein YcaP (DUF421 family)